MSRYGYVPPNPSAWGGVLMLIFIANVIFSTVQYCSRQEPRIPAQPIKTKQVQDPS